MRTAVNAVVYVVLAVAIVLVAIPILWLVDNSFKSIVEIEQYPPRIFNFDPTWSSYQTLFSDPAFIRSAITSLVVTAASTVITLLVSLLNAYALVRLRTPFRRVFVVGLVSLQTVPGIVLVIPQFYLATALGLYDSWIGLIIVFTALSVPFSTWILVAFIRSIPIELEEAALVDGARRASVLARIVLPLVAPGAVTAAILTAIACWNQFLIPVVLGQSRAETLTVYVSGFVSLQKIDWGALSAAALVVMAPIVLFALAAQRRLVEGLTLGSLKG